MVSRITQSQVQALDDMMSADNFVFLFSKIPNWGGDGFSDLTIKALSAAIPGAGQEDFQVTIAGFVRNFRGRRIYNHQIDLTFAETVDMSTHNALRNWFEYVAGTDSGTSGDYVKGYAVTGSIYTFDTTGVQADLANFYRIRPVQMPDTQLSGEGTQAMQTSCTFTFDWCNFNKVTVR